METHLTAPSARSTRQTALHFPLSSAVLAASTLALDHLAITLVEQPRGLVIGHLGSNRETQDGAQLRRKAGSSALEIGFENADATDLDGQR